MTVLVLCLLGGFQARLPSSRPLTIRSKRAQALLACLAVAPGNILTRDKVAGILWSYSDDGHARNSLRQSLTMLRHDLVAVEPFPIIAEGDRLVLDRAAVDVDVWSFERLAASNDFEQLRKGADLYRGDFLDGIHLSDPAFEEWSAAERDRLRRLASDVFERLAARQIGGDAITAAQRLLALDTLREASHRVAMQAYAAQGEVDLALRQYKTCREILRRELGVEPDAETQDLYRRVRDTRSAQIDTKHSAPFVSIASRELLTDPAQKPAVALLPFVNMSTDPHLASFGDGLAEDIITELSRFHSLFIIARSSSFQYRDRAIDVNLMGQALKAQYILEGSVRTIGRSIRITVQLIDAATGNHLWAERYDRDIQDMAQVQDKLTAAIVAGVAAQIRAAATEQARRKRTESLAAYELLHLGLEYLNRAGSDDIVPARLLFQQAIEIDPNYAQAHAHLADTFGESHWIDVYRAGSAEAGLDRALESAVKAVALDDSDAVCHCVLGANYLCAKSFDLARLELDRAIELNPNDPDLLVQRGALENFTGQPQAALDLFDRAERLNLRPPNWYRHHRGLALYGLGQYAEASAAFERMIVRPTYVVRYLAASYAQSGRPAEARATAAAALNMEPGFNLRRYAVVEPYRSGADLDHMMAGMRNAGLPA
ncbi:adenylate cyclase [Hypericibacter terrae]|uniref:Adenylate cyclase n=1 Tax=Hypericibacter terrae TaxID=2602015 RepID=A0A5J6MKE1_9PROT|nr:BTAD domain-containing putative transcriptional regulator [Hypericibacter terrae]QEX15196.1 adenylate cyclase [Hypericibacter terrae]